MDSSSSSSSSSSETSGASEPSEPSGASEPSEPSEGSETSGSSEPSGGSEPSASSEPSGGSESSGGSEPSAGSEPGGGGESSSSSEWDCCNKPCVDYTTWEHPNPDDPDPWLGVHILTWPDATHPDHPGCTYKVTVRVKGIRKFRPGVSGFSNRLCDFLSVLRFEESWSDPSPGSCTLPADQVSEPDDIFPGVFLNTDWDVFAKGTSQTVTGCPGQEPREVDGYSKPANYSGLSEVVNTFMTEGVKLIPPGIPPQC